jgi:hypothetical protein
MFIIIIIIIIEAYTDPFIDHTWDRALVHTINMCLHGRIPNPYDTMKIACRFPTPTLVRVQIR